jgi:hypothetical protein
MRTFCIEAKGCMIVASVDEGKVIDIGDTLGQWKYKNWEWCLSKISEYGWTVEEAHGIGPIDFSL